MCGILGFTNKNFSEDLNYLTSLQKHRGPDSNGLFKDGNISLIHNRLSILDVKGGSQPMQDDKNIIVYNGEIFNAPDLREELEKKGIKFKSKNSDTEVLLKLYKYKKFKMLEDLNGMFSFVIYDKIKNILFGAVDKFSIKPMYYFNKNSNFIFASELKTILSFKNVSKEISLKNINYYFNLQYSPFDETIYKDIKKLTNSSYFVYDLNEKKFINKKYKYIPKSIVPHISNYEQAVGTSKNFVEESVKRWMLSDVSVSCSLSGGLDSSLIASIYSKYSSKKIDTITVGFESDNSLFDERVYAKKVSKFLNTDHNEVIINPDTILDDMDLIFDNLSEPYGGSLASWYIYKNLNHHKVIFTGTGADELFGNYGKWKQYSLSEIFFKNLIYSIKNQEFSNFKNNYHGFLYKKIFYQEELKSILNEEFYCDKDVSLEIQKLVNLSKKKDPKKLIQEIDLNLQLPGEFLYITDRLSMLNSIEARTPFLDLELFNHISTLNSKYYGGLLNSKKLLKDIAKDYLPNEIINRRKKGFVLPKKQWLKKNLLGLLKFYSSENFIKSQGIFKPNKIQELVKIFLSNNNDFLTERIWTFFIFQFWYEKNYRTPII
jgi:asparagine synthase (glutamine-hydrolysing)